MSNTGIQIRTLFFAEQVAERVDTLAGELYKRYKDANPLFVCFLKGGLPFTVQLMQALSAHAEAAGEPFYPDVDYMVISTYGTGTKAKEPRIVTDLADTSTVKDRLVVMLDDVHDSGTTMHFADQHFRVLGATEVESVVLVQKTGRERPLYPEATLYGFASASDEWLIGMGMNGDPRVPDQTEAGRWLDYICIVEPVS